jgi:hypothetical protein
MNFLRSRFSLFAVSIFLTLFALQISVLEAASWGDTEEVSEYEGVTWNGVFFDLNGLYFTASIPNYSGASLQNNDVKVEGNADGNLYGIVTTFNGKYSPPSSLNKFIKSIEELNPGYIVSAIDAHRFGAKYAVELVPSDLNNPLIVRFFCTKNRIIQMGTIDTNLNRRAFFFDSLLIH